MYIYICLCMYIYIYIYEATEVETTQVALLNMLSSASWSLLPKQYKDTNSV